MQRKRNFIYVKIKNGKSPDPRLTFVGSYAILPYVSNLKKQIISSCFALGSGSRCDGRKPLGVRGNSDASRIWKEMHWKEIVIVYYNFSGASSTVSISVPAFFRNIFTIS